MEEVAWFFNSDFEACLFAGKYAQFNSSKKNQEFEYLINFIEPSCQIYTLKDYPLKFREYFKDLTQEDFKTTTVRKNLKPWCQEYREVELLKKWQSKAECLMRFKELGLIKHEVEIIKDQSQLQPNYLYKDPHNLSGCGHFEYSKDKSKIEKLLLSKSLLKDELLERVIDFSTLIQGHQILSCYENIVDKYFQYKGTYIGENNFLSKDLKEQYENSLDVIQNELIEYEGIFSVDSFVYKKNNMLHLQPVCEINMRKTMGYAAYKLKQIFFPHSKLMAFKLRKKSKDIDHAAIYQFFTGEVIILASNSCLFVSYLIAGNNKSEIMLKEEKLISTFF